MHAAKSGSTQYDTPNMATVFEFYSDEILCVV